MRVRALFGTNLFVIDFKTIPLNEKYRFPFIGKPPLLLFEIKIQTGPPQTQQRTT